MMFLLTIICLCAVYLLTIHDSRKVKQVIWLVYGGTTAMCLIGLLLLDSGSNTYYLGVQIFFLFLVSPVLTLVVRKIWVLSSGTEKWVQYVVVIPVSLLFILTLWISWNAFSIFLYIL
jgi:hypothetical protein